MSGSAQPHDGRRCRAAAHRMRRRSFGKRAPVPEGEEGPNYSADSKLRKAGARASLTEAILLLRPKCGFRRIFTRGSFAKPQSPPAATFSPRLGPLNSDRIEALGGPVHFTSRRSQAPRCLLSVASVVRMACSSEPSSIQIFISLRRCLILSIRSTLSVSWEQNNTSRLRRISSFKLHLLSSAASQSL